MTNTKIARSDVVIQIRTYDLTIVCQFNLNELSLHPRKKIVLYYSASL